MYSFTYVKNDNFDKYGNIFHMYNICICGIYMYKTHFPITGRKKEKKPDNP